MFQYTGNSTNGTLNYCAFGNNSLSFISDDACPDGYEPWQMTCALGEVMGRMFHGSGSFGSGLPVFDITRVGNEPAFHSQLEQLAPPSYLRENPGYYGCAVAATAAVLTVFAVMNGGMGLMQVGQPLLNVSKALAAAQTMVEILDRKSAIDAFDEGGATLPSTRGEIEVRDVVFAYPTAPEHNVCRGYTLRVEAGQTCALCGPSGSGKSTIIALLERFYDPQQGAVLLDGVDIRTLNVRWLRQQMGLVGQEPVLFMGTVAENIAYGKPRATQAEIEAAAKMANAHNFIMEGLADGYESEVGQGGSKLSGGQKQRVAIARALIKSPVCLLLDEATSALDNESERVVQAALDEIMAKQKRTTVVIAHRLSTIRNADTIAVVNEGRVVESGSHDDLLGEGGLYASLVLSKS